MFKKFAVAAVAAGALFMGVSSYDAQGAELSGEIKIDGSSTVFPLTEGVSEEFMKLHPKVKITVGVSGTGGGFKKFARGETDISDASRPIKSSEAEDCKTNGIRFMGLPVAIDALSVVVNRENTWADKMSVEDLKKMWSPDAQGKVMNWSQVKDGWPAEKIGLFGAGSDSGTFDYFTEVINGKSGSTRTDYTATEDDHVTIKGVLGSKYAIGYLGYSYYVAHKDEMKAVAIQDKGKTEYVAPSPETVLSGTYTPLARPILIYINDKALARPEVARFSEFYLDNMNRLSKTIGFVELPARVVRAAKKRLEDREFSDKDIFTAPKKAEAKPAEKK